MIALCMIVKDEVEDLDRCLTSTKGVFDAIYLTFTAEKSDALEAVARKHGAHVSFFPWNDNFADARNYAFLQVPKKYRWVAWLDCDDTLENPEKLKPLLEKADFGCLMLPYDVPPYRYYRERVVRNRFYRWEGRIHETLGCPESDRRSSDEVWVKHHEKTHPDPLAWLHRQRIMQEEADKGDPRMIYYLARHHVRMGNPHAAIPLFKKYLTFPDRWVEERYMASHELADLYRQVGPLTESFEQDQETMRIIPEAPDAYFGLAETCYLLKDWDRVIIWSEVGMTKHYKFSMIHDPLDQVANWIIFYTFALIQRDRLAEAKGWTKRALKYLPDDAYHLQNLRYLESVVQ